MIINKIYRIFFLITFCLVLVGTTTGCSFAKGRFIELDFTQEDNNQPVKLNEEEIFFPGGWNGSNTKKIIPAKVYNIRTKKLSSLNATMNFPRSGYGAIKYDDNNVLIIGGYCLGEKVAKRCFKVAEVYDIKENKFIRIKDSNLDYSISVKTALVDEGNVFILSGTKFELFNSKNKTFSLLAENLDYVDYLQKYTKNFFGYPNIIPLNKNEILIYGFKTRNIEYESEIFVMEIFNLSTKISTDIPVDYSFFEYYNIGRPVKVDDNTILFIGVGNDKRDVIKFNISERKFNYYKRLPQSLAGEAFLLDNDNIIFVRGGIYKPDYIKGTSLVHAVYDYKKNKIYNRKISHKSYYISEFIPFKNLIYISGYKKQKPMLYKY